MATDADLIAAGIILPIGSDYISEGDDAISANARVLWDRVEGARYLKPTNTANSNDTLDSLPSGMIAIRSGPIAAALDLPVAVTGFVEKAVISSDSGIATFYARRGTGSQEIWTTTLSTGGWAEWERADAGGVVIPDQEDSGLTGNVTVWGSSTPAGLVPELASEMRDYGTQVHQKARGGQWSSQTVANIGCTPVTIPVVGGTIPASGPVELDTAASILDGVDLYLTPQDGLLMGWLGGVYGELVGTGTSFTDRGATFTRATSGPAVSVAAPEWVPEVKTPTHLNIIGMGKNDLNVGRTQGHLERLISRKDDAASYWASLGQEFLFLGHFVNTGTPASDEGRTYIEADNADSAERYSENFLDMQELLSGDELWYWTGITPTSEDLAQQDLGNMPPSIKGTGNHLNDSGDRYLSFKIAQWAVDRGLIGQGKVPFDSTAGLRTVYLNARGS